MTPRRMLLAGYAGLALAASARARSWPDRPLRLIVPFPPGGPTDLVGGAPVALVVHADVPARSVAEFVAWTRAQPDPMPYGTGLAPEVGPAGVRKFRPVVRPRKLDQAM